MPVPQTLLTAIDSGSLEAIDQALKSLAIELARQHGPEEVEKIFQSATLRVMFEKNPSEWTTDMDGLLGTVSDNELAKRFDMPIIRVRQRRLALGVEPFQPDQRQWSAEEDALLGEHSIQDVAARLNISSSQVRKRMDELGIGRTAVAQRETWADLSYTIDLTAFFLYGAAQGQVYTLAESDTKNARMRAMMFIRYTWERWAYTQGIKNIRDIKRFPDLIREAIRRARIEMASIQALLKPNGWRTGLSEEQTASTREVWGEPLSPEIVRP